jgi:clan AA aspartic protease
VHAIVYGPSGASANVELLVDSGAKYSVLPHDVWTAIGLEPKRTLDFMLADGTKIERRVSECRFVLDGNDAHSPVVLGEPGDAALLGTVTLEVFGLVLNPFDRTLRPARMLMA